MTESPLFGYPNVIVTPHLGASTAEATDRAGYQSAEQVVAALDRRRRLDGGEHPGDRRRGHGDARAVPAAGHAARAPGDGAGRGQLGGADRGRVPGADRRLRHAPAGAGGDRRRARRPHRGAGQPRQRPDDGPAAGDRVRGEGGLRGRGLQRADPRDRDRRRRARRGRGHGHRPEPGAAPGRGAGAAADDRARALT